MPEKLHVAVLLGGRSAEHEVSLLSAKNVVGALDRERFEPLLIGIDKAGVWSVLDPDCFLNNADNPKLVSLVPSSRTGMLCMDSGNCYFHEFDGGKRSRVDAVFPVLHGTFGEDGTVQGLLQLLDVPFVGPDLLGSSMAMDKDVSKKILRFEGIPVCPWHSLRKHEYSESALEKAFNELGPDLFVKPANLGSSVGVSRARSFDELISAVQIAFRFDLKVVIEQAFPGREIECAVLGNLDPKGSVFGEIIPAAKHGFYSYEAKYIDPDGAALIVPAEVDKSLAEEITRIAIKSFQALCLEGMARVDFLLKPDGSFVVNELNTIPGFTKISMYPRLWGESGVSYTELISQLIDFGLSRHQQRTALSTENN